MNRGLALLEVLFAVALTLVVSGVVAGLIASFAYASIAQRQAADEQQRLRAAVDQIGAWVSVAGQGLGGTGPNEGRLLVPARYPQRRGVSGADADTSAFVDRITIVAGTDPPAAG